MDLFESGFKETQLGKSEHQMFYDIKELFLNF